MQKIKIKIRQAFKNCSIVKESRTQIDGKAQVYISHKHIE